MIREQYINLGKYDQIVLCVVKLFYFSRSAPSTVFVMSLGLVRQLPPKRWTRATTKTKAMCCNRRNKKVHCWVVPSCGFISFTCCGALVRSATGLRLSQANRAFLLVVRNRHNNNNNNKLCTHMQLTHSGLTDSANDTSSLVMLSRTNLCTERRSDSHESTPACSKRCNSTVLSIVTGIATNAHKSNTGLNKKPSWRKCYVECADCKRL